MHLQMQFLEEIGQRHRPRTLEISLSGCYCTLCGVCVPLGGGGGLALAETFCAGRDRVGGGGLALPVFDWVGRGGGGAIRAGGGGGGARRALFDSGGGLDLTFPACIVQDTGMEGLRGTFGGVIGGKGIPTGGGGLFGGQRGRDRVLVLTGVGVGVGVVGAGVSVGTGVVGVGVEDGVCRTHHMSGPP